MKVYELANELHVTVEELQQILEESGYTRNYQAFLELQDNEINFLRNMIIPWDMVTYEDEPTKYKVKDIATALNVEAKALLEYLEKIHVECKDGESSVNEKTIQRLLMHFADGDEIYFVRMNDDLGQLAIKNRPIGSLQLYNRTLMEQYVEYPESESVIKPPEAYLGNEPYIFISHAHLNRTEIWPIISKLQEHGCRIWYDNGITPGSEWDDNIAEHVMNCHCLIACISKEYLSSPNCKDELKYAKDEGKAEVLLFLEKVELPPALKLRFGRSQYINLYECNDENALYQKLINVPEIYDCISIQK